MAKLSVVLCFALFTGASAFAIAPAKHMSVLDHKHEVSISSSSEWSGTAYSDECFLKRTLSLSSQATALFQNKAFLQQMPDGDGDGNGDGDGDAVGDYQYGDGDGDYSEISGGPVGGDGDGDGDGELGWGDGDGEIGGDGNGEVNEGTSGTIPPGGPIPSTSSPAPPVKPPPAAPIAPPPSTTVTVLKDGFMETQCVKDRMYYHGDKYGKGHLAYKLGKNSKTSIVRYDMVVPKEDQEQMTPKVCFEFCRSVPDMGFFGILNGYTCYCTPYYQQMAGDSSMCEEVCPGDPTNMCGGKTKSQIYGMHMCASAKTDLKANIEKAVAAEAKMKKKVATAKALATNMQSGAKSLQKRLGAVGDAAATNLMQKAKVAAGELEKQAQDGEKIVAELAALADQPVAVTESVRKAESVTEVIEKTLTKGREFTRKLDKLLDASTSSADDSGKDIGTALQYYPLMYFVDKDFVAMPSTCSGDLVGAPMADVSLDACAWACDEHVDTCIGFSYYAQEKLCFLMSKFDTASYYTGCKTSGQQSSFLQQRKLADIACMAKFSEFEGTTLKPDPSGKCKRCLKAITKADRCISSAVGDVGSA